MARVSLASASIHNVDRDVGTDLTAIAGDTIVTGADNGLIIPYTPSRLLVLRNETAGSAVVTIKTANPAGAAAVNLTVADKSVTVGIGLTLLYPASAIFRQVGEVVWLDCDVAIEVAAVLP